uniref:NADH-ubiquinone oxidoreductase chain 2 n=1 Tax=Thelepus plagiostoma TaxID=1084972 RepID=A0A8B6QMG1_9ANNE|nr:NADH dehydrogenase subunit 2 [Thelepus plagiostoma]QTJ29904.1 NADH dehydrogenase subunit 2 [Thelepus plagiostoma]
MMLQMGRHYSIMLSSFLSIGILISITSSNWFMVWMGLELNLYAFIPFILQTSNHLEKEAALKYFFAQALASALLLMSILFIYVTPTMSTFTIMAIIMKLGAAPCHFWFPSVMNASPWPTCWLLTTIQKIAPLMMLNLLFMHTQPIFMYMLATFSAIVGALGGFNQSHMRPLLAYSSIHHIGWMIASMSISKILPILYFMSYMIISSSLFFFLHKLNMNKLSPQTMNLHNNYSIISIILNMLSLGGQPPLLGFFPKMMIIFTLMNNNLVTLAIILIITSTTSLYFYMKIILYSMFSYSIYSSPSSFLLNKTSFSILAPASITAVSTILFSVIIIISL